MARPCHRRLLSGATCLLCRRSNGKAGASLGLSSPKATSVCCANASRAVNDCPCLTPLQSNTYSETTHCAVLSSFVPLLLSVALLTGLCRSTTAMAPSTHSCLMRPSCTSACTATTAAVFSQAARRAGLSEVVTTCAGAMDVYTSACVAFVYYCFEYCRTGLPSGHFVAYVHSSAHSAPHAMCKFTNGKIAMHSRCLSAETSGSTMRQSASW